MKAEKFLVKRACIKHDYNSYSYGDNRKRIKMELLPKRSNSWINIFFYIYVTTGIFISSCHGQQQKFRISPHDLQVLEGSEALMRCEVSNQAGQVQWTKDGFALGFSAVIPGFPRYSVLGDRAQGVYNLRISNASIEDDAEYQCQVGPAKFNSAIRANAKLTVISPPSSIEIQGYTHNSKVEVRENQNLTLTCIVSDAKPAAQIQWFRGNVEYKPENRENKVEETQGKRFTTTSRLQLKPSAEDDYTEYTCQAKHKALQPDMPMRATVQLSVLYPPGPPYIEGYTQGETLRRGQTIELMCRSRGGNPPAQLIWYKNGAQVRMAYRTAGRLSENIYTFTAESSDDKAKFRCEASNIMSQTPLKAEVELSVLFAPTHVSISGPSEARVGDPVPLTCTTAPSNPPAEIKWMVGGRQIRNATSRTVPSPEGGWITSSNYTAIVEPNKRSLVVICHGLNMQLTENVVSTHTVNVLYPPSTPIISGYVEKSIIPAGSIQKLMCISSGGNPLATLTWYKNDKKINSVQKVSDKSVSAELTILANVTDNQAQYRCEAHNSATEIPLFETKTLSVHFAPETVKIRVEPDELKHGVEATLICDSSSSNPPSKVSWWKDGIPVEGINNSSKPGLWGGTVSTLELKVNITQDMNGVVYTCQSSNEALQRSVHEAITLEVLYPPKFVPPPSSTVVGVEGEPLQVVLMANANPMSITYTWTKDGIPITMNEPERVVSDGPVLNITKLARNDGGIYTCEAVNSQGVATINITVMVEYGTAIKSVSENVIVNPGDEATLSCTVEGKPLTEEHVRWERPGYDMSEKTKTTFANGTSFLHFKNARREDVGNFRCVADNRVANPTSRDVLLIVKFAPEINKSPTMLRAASGTGERGRLPCRAQAAPQPKFHWTHGGQPLNVNRTYKYGMEVRQIDQLTYESTLIIEKVAPADYGVYECVAENPLGKTKAEVRLDITSPPDMPLNLSVLNVTHDSVTVAWTPGFDGGMKPSYRVRYREASSEHYKYQDSGNTQQNKMTITGLRMNTLYLFSVMAMNALGSSKYLPDLQRAMTKGSEPSPAELLEKSEMPNLVIIGIALAALGLLLVNAALVAWFVIKKRNKASNQNSKTATIEMYAPSSYNDTVTGETLSSVSEKSDSYSNEGSQPDYMDETRKKAASTYLVENTDIPPPRYQKDGTLPSLMPNNTANSVNTRTLPHPRHNNNTTLMDHRSRDDQILMTKGTYIPSPSPAPPLDGSYYNMNSDRYLSYPPMDYPPMEFSTPPLPLTHMQPNQTMIGGGSGGGGTLRRGAIGMRAMVPPPDVTHHTTKIPHDIHPNSTTASTQTNGSTLQTTAHQLSNLSNLSQVSSHQTSTPKQPQGILKDPKRNQQQPPLNTMQILNVQNAPNIGNSLLIGNYDPNTHNLSTFNATMGYSDADGHLV